MSQTVTVDYSYDVEAISRSVRKTNVFLRGSRLKDNSESPYHCKRFLDFDPVDKNL
jgi:hypothetical protein